MKNKNLILIIVGILLIALMLLGVFLIPKIFKKEPKIITVISTVTTSSMVSKSTSLAPEKVYKMQELIAASHSVIAGQVIGAEVDYDGAVYKIKIIKVYKGRNYTSLGTVFVNGAPCMKIGSSYLIFANVGEGRYEQYEYSEPILGAPWIFKIGEDKTLIHSSNGNIDMLSDADNLTLQKIEELLK